MGRCIHCGKRIWPWQRRGWYTVSHVKRVNWHGKCWRQRRFVR